MKKNRFLSLLGVFLLSASVLLPTTNKIAVKANDVNDDPNELIYIDFIDFDYVRYTYSGDVSVQEVVFDYTGTAFKHNESYYSNTYFEIYTHDSDFSSGSAITQEFNFNASYPIYNGKSVIPFTTAFNMATYDEYLYNANFEFFSHDVVIPVEILENNLYRCHSFFLLSNEDDSLLDFADYISYFSCSFTIIYYDQINKQLSSLPISINYDPNNLVFYNNMFLPYAVFLDYLDYNTKNMLVLSDFSFSFTLSYHYQEEYTPLLYLNSFLLSQNDFIYFDQIFNQLLLYVPSLEQADFSNWLVDGIGGFLSFEIIPGISLSIMLAVIIAIPLLVSFLKIFAGG